MTFRAIALGVLLGLFVAAFTYFNDQVIRQTLFVGNHLPASVFGTGLLLLLVLNPLLRFLGERLGRRNAAGPDPASGVAAGLSPGDRWVLKPSELAIILALGLAVCAWPGSNLFRYFPQMVTLPVARLPTQPSWLSSDVMSYIPGQSPLLAKGYVQDWDALLGFVRSGAAADGPAAARRLWERMPEPARRVAIKAGPAKPEDRTTVVRGINAALSDDTLYDPTAFPEAASAPATAYLLARRAAGGESWRLFHVQTLNRRLLESVLPGAIRPPPRGEGVLLQAGEHAPSVLEHVTGRGDDDFRLDPVPWRAWWPTLRLWGGAILLASLAALCLIVIVHPQWSQRELLRYPTVEFVHEMTRWTPGRYLPDIAGSRLFWLAVVPVIVMHLANGINLYYPEFPRIQRDFGFEGMRDLFPMASRVPGQDRLFHPTIYPSVIGFGYFVTTRVSLSIGLSLVFWIVLGAALIGWGQPVSNDEVTIGAVGPSLRFGAYAGMTLMILYFGRRYYWNVLQATVGLPRAADTPAYAVWAARLFAPCAAASAYLLIRYAGFDPLIAALFLGLFLMMLVVLARINAETGLFYAQPDWLIGTMLAGVFGVSGLGAEHLIVLLLASQIFAADPREGVSPYLANGLRLADRGDGAGGSGGRDSDATRISPRRLAPWLAGMLILGFLVSLVTTLTIQYNWGMNLTDGFANVIPIRSVEKGAQTLGELDARGELEAVTRVTGLGHFKTMNPDANAIKYASAGLVLVLVCAVARIRLPWWPIHPILFLVWGNYPANLFAVSFLFAALVKTTVTRIGGAKAYGDAKPLMVGLIAGDVLMIIVWSIIGTIYYFNTGLTPPAYRILPI